MINKMLYHILIKLLSSYLANTFRQGAGINI